MIIVSLELTEHQRHLISEALVATSIAYRSEVNKTMQERGKEMSRLRVIIDQARPTPVSEALSKVQQ